jgi:hypothetical protein
MHHEKTIHE